MNRSLKYLVALFSLLIFPGQKTYSTVSASSLTQRNEKQLLIKDQSPASIVISDIEDDTENDLKSIELPVFVSFCDSEIHMAEKNFPLFAFASPATSVKKNILFAVFRI